MKTISMLELTTVVGGATGYGDPAKSVNVDQVNKDASRRGVALCNAIAPPDKLTDCLTFAQKDLMKK